MVTSTEQKNRIKLSESLKLKAYLCPAGVPTIGYGHTGLDVTKQDVANGKTITLEEANKLLDSDIYSKAEVFVNKYVKVKLTQNQYDSLVDFVYNVGGGNFIKSSLLRKININPLDPTIRDEFMKWTKGGGKVLPGLVKRREEEANIYFK